MKTALRDNSSRRSRVLHAGGAAVQHDRDVLQVQLELQKDAEGRSCDGDDGREHVTENLRTRGGVRISSFPRASLQLSVVLHIKPWTPFL